MILFTRVLPDDNPRILKYSSGWSNDRSLNRGIDFIAFEGSEYAHNAVKAFDTINSFTLSLIALAIIGKIKTSCKK